MNKNYIKEYSELFYNSIIKELLDNSFTINELNLLIRDFSMNNLIIIKNNKDYSINEMVNRIKAFIFVLDSGYDFIVNNLLIKKMNNKFSDN